MSGKIVRLPTAARRAVKQTASADYRRAFCEANPWPGEFKWPAMRRMEAEVEARAALGRGEPGRVLAIALYAALAPEQRDTVRRMLAPGAVAGLPAFRAALERLDELAHAMQRDAAWLARSDAPEAE
jgi:hypothetical protein